MITETNHTTRPLDHPAAGEGRPPAAPAAAAARRVARNSVVPMAATLGARAMSMLLAAVMARTLGAEGTGAYAVAVNLWLYASIVSDFGLGTWLTREVARAPDADGVRQTVGEALALRLFLSAAAVPSLVAAGVLAGYVQSGTVDGRLVATVLLLGAGLLPGAISATGTSLFNAHERMTFPALVQLITAALTTAGGIAVLLLGFDMVALAWVSLAVNLATAAVFAVASARSYFPLGLAVRPLRQLAVARDSLPLMLNGLLNNVFFRFDVQVLQSKGSAVVGYYANAYKVIDAAGALPSSFVLALFPLLARRAAEATGGPASAAGGGLARLYGLALKLLLAMALPLAVLVTVTADGLIWLFLGPSFLPHSAIALRVLIWFLPLSCFNGLTQYVLIALGRQRWITLAFAVAAVFNVVANLVLIPHFSYLAAAAVTIATELVLLVPFLIGLHRRLEVAPLLLEAVRPLPAAAGAGLVLWWLVPLSAPLAFLAAGLLYPLLLYLSGAFDPAERRLLATFWR